MLRYGRRTERHDTLRTLLQQLRISDIFNPDHGQQRYVPHQVHKTRKRTLVQRRTKHVERRRRRRHRHRVSRHNNTSTQRRKHSLVVAVAIKPPPFFYTRVVGVPLLVSHKIEMFSLERIKYSEPSRHEQKTTRTTSYQANSRAIGG